MSNLIPQFAKKKITTEYWLRVVTVWFLLWGLALLIATILLFPVYIFTSVQIAVNAESAESAEASVASFENIAFDLKKASLQARYLIEDDRRNKAYQYIDLFESHKRPGIEIRKIAFSTDGDKVKPIVISGIASDRESLAAFRDSLLADEAIEKADLPISNLAKDKNISYTITVTIAKGVTL